MKKTPPHTPKTSRQLTPQTFAQAVNELTAQNPILAHVVKKWGHPPLWTQPTGFAGLTWTVLGQQVSLESAAATFKKLSATLKPLTPARFLTLSDEQLKTIGFSRQKTSYVRGIAQEIETGTLSIAALHRMDDEKARTRLLQIRGIGKWTADTYLLFSMKRPDAWPSGDLALEKAYSDLKGAPKKMSTEQVDQAALAWKPWRAVAARILWAHYLHERNRF